jgi:hypothetical protein
MVFGPSGIWKEFLGRVDGFIGTEIRCESDVEGRYRVLDFWTLHWKFEAFRERFAAEYERFNQLVLAEGLVQRQEIVGTYYETDGGGGDESVPA